MTGTRMAAVPFTLRRSKDEFFATGFSSTTETAHGLLRLEGERIVIQWRVARKTESYTSVALKTDEDMDPVQEVVIPLEAVATAFVRRRWWEFWRGPQMVLTAADLRAFDQVAGESGLRMSHPAEIAVRIRRRDLVLAEEFTADLTLAVAELAAGRIEASGRLGAGSQEGEPGVGSNHEPE